MLHILKLSNDINNLISSRHDMAEILVKLVLNTNQSINKLKGTKLKVIILINTSLYFYYRYTNKMSKNITPSKSFQIPTEKS